MKITSPFNTLEPSEEDFSYYHSFFQNAIEDTLLLQEMGTANKKKKRRISEETNSQVAEPESDKSATKKKALTQLLTSFLILDEQEKTDQLQHDQETQHQKEILEANHKEKTQAMLDYYSHMQDYYSDTNDRDRVRAKRTRLAASGAAAVSAAVSDAPAQQVGAAAVHHRRLWVKDRSKAWWDRCNSPDFPEHEFRRAFRMGRSTFEMICEELGSAVAKEDTMLRAAIPVRQRVAVCIWRLATGEPLRLVSKRFGLGISTCHKLVLEVCSAIKSVLMPKFLPWPDNETLAKIQDEFESLSGIPNVVGSMYTTHIPIIAPKISVAAYFNKRHTERNQKTSYSITVQGVVDPNGVFTDVCIGWPGSMPDDQVLEKSALHQRALNGLLKGMWIVGSSGYPLMDWVLVPYTQQQLTWTKHAFNEKIGEIQRTAKDAFMRLKGRWSCLQKRTEVKLQDLPVVLGACCVLHNICEMRKEAMDPELNYELIDDEMVPENPLRSGCDASILLNHAGSEREAKASETLRGFQLIDDIKAEVEKKCPKKVSCADILTAAARDATVRIGGPFWEVPYGRKDGLISEAKDVESVPMGRENVTYLIEFFQSKGLNLLDLVVLSGSHTIGRSTCGEIQDRLYNYKRTGQPDPTIDIGYLNYLKRKCRWDSEYVDLDGTTPTKFDSAYYMNLQRNMGLLSTDQLLNSDPRTKPLIIALATQSMLFYQQFAVSMTKLGNTQVLTGKEGEIRMNCNSVNY